VLFMTIFFVFFQLVDLCLLDEGSLQFPYSVLAASAVHHMSSMEDALSVSGECYSSHVTRC
jgi:G1/S-specific cyclin-E1